MRKLLPLLAALLFSLTTQAGDLPPQLVGIWTTEETVLRGASLLGGTALYLSENGKGALVGAPLPVMRCPDNSICRPLIGVRLFAVLEEGNDALHITLVTEDGKSIPLETIYDAKEAVVVIKLGNEENRLVRRSADVPEEFKAVLNGRP
jgi:hypothetical protein